MSKNVTNNAKIVVEWNKALGDKNKPYAYRWRIDFYYFSIRMHKWICSDDIRAFHSHPINMLIFIIWGRYIDHQPNVQKLYKFGMFRYIPRDYRHYVEILQSPTYTILFTWGIPKRWSFWDKLTGKKMNRDRYFIEKGHSICDFYK